MSRRLFLYSLLTALAMSLGCRHPTGYVGVYRQYTPLGAPQQVEHRLADDPVRLVKEMTPESVALAVSVEDAEISSGPAVCETYGRQTWVPWRWYAPLLKPLAAVTVVAPLWLSARDPHCHAARNWRGRDYLRDVISWYNPFSGVPVGGRLFAMEATLIRVEEVNAPLSERRLPAPGRTVTISLDGERQGEAVTDADGVAQFDMTPYLARLLPGAHVIRFGLVGEGGETTGYTWTLKADLLQNINAASK